MFEKQIDALFWAADQMCLNLSEDQRHEFLDEMAEALDSRLELPHGQMIGAIDKGRGRSCFFEVGENVKPGGPHHPGYLLAWRGDGDAVVGVVECGDTGDVCVVAAESVSFMDRPRAQGDGV